MSQPYARTRTHGPDTDIVDIETFAGASPLREYYKKFDFYGPTTAGPYCFKLTGFGESKTFQIDGLYGDKVDQYGQPITGGEGLRLLKTINWENFCTEEVQEWMLQVFRLQPSYVDSMASAPFTTIPTTSSYIHTRMDDIVTPGFKKIQKSGGIVNSPMSQVKNVFMASPPVYGSTAEQVLTVLQNSITSNGFYVIYQWAPRVDLIFSCPTEIAIEIQSQADALCIHDDYRNSYNTALSRIDNADLDTLVAMAEAKKTLATLTLGLARVSTLFKQIKRGQISKITDSIRGKGLSKKQQADRLQDAWLEARYAWRPIIYDINGAIKALQRGKTLTPRRTFRGSTTKVDDEVISFQRSVNGYTYDVEGVAEVTQHCRSGVLCEALLETSVPHSLGLFNVAKAGWELVPWSFVIDWFINTGYILRSLKPIASFKEKTAWANQETEVKFSGIISITAPNGEQKDLEFTQVYLRKDRIPIDPSFSITVDVNFSLLKLLDSIALLRSLR